MQSRIQAQREIGTFGIIKLSGIRRRVQVNFGGMGGEGKERVESRDSEDTRRGRGRAEGRRGEGHSSNLVRIADRQPRAPREQIAVTAKDHRQA
jgi:hypothetical protein